MMILAVWIELALHMPVQRSLDADPRDHRRAAKIGDQDQGFHGSLPFRCRVDGLRKLGDEVAGIAQCVERATVAQGYRFVELAGPALRLIRMRSRT